MKPPSYLFYFVRSLNQALKCWPFLNLHWPFMAFGGLEIFISLFSSNSKPKQMNQDERNHVLQVVSMSSVKVAFLTFQLPFLAFTNFLWLINARLSISITLMTILAKGTSKTIFASFQPKQLSVKSVFSSIIQQKI